MRKEICKLFNKLFSKEQNVRNRAYFIISNSVERALVPKLSKENEGFIQDEELLNIELSNEEAFEILDRICIELPGDKLALYLKVAFMDLLFKSNKIKYFEASLEFLKEYYDNLDNQQIYSALASINPQYFSQKDFVLITESIQKNRLGEILVALSKRNNDKVNDAVFNMWCKLKGIDYLDECYYGEYIRFILWYIQENHLLLCPEEMNSILKLLSVEYFTGIDLEVVESVLRKYDFLSILEKIKTRKFQDFIKDLKRETPGELFEIIESFDEKEYEKDQEALKKTIEDIRSFIFNLPP